MYSNNLHIHVYYEIVENFMINHHNVTAEFSEDA